RLATVAAATAVLGAALLAAAISIAGAFDAAGAAAAATVLLAPAVVDLALLATTPIERMLSRRWTARAVARLEAVDPLRVAVTGSFGKTTVKGYLRHLLTGTRTVVASPASFNNTAGLCRAVNEHLLDGTDVFIAEMGAYRLGEIAAMTRWVRPEVSVLTSIGPVHLERFGSLDNVVAAKTEIFATSRTAVVNVDAHAMADEAARLAASGIRVVTCSAVDPDADVVVPAEPSGDAAASDDARTITVFGRRVRARIAPDATAGNVACAVGAAAALGVPDADIAARLATLPGTEHRRRLTTSASGVVVVDDTYNSNPEGAAAALALLAGTPAGRRVVVTPGMVELGSVQREANAEFARAAAGVADDLLLVGRTNRAALAAGTADGSARVLLVDSREEAVAWVRANLAAGDAVLYENDLPDHYP
ncbi:MAG TPA: hypothetical protein DEP69_03755, partial [Acidimicrobiaceae bacterium]|nr:hypothetical protein [Acidimicrobiaceae bacterium]